MNRPNIRGIIQSLYDGMPPSNGNLVAKEIKLALDGKKVLVALDSNDYLHLLLPPSSKSGNSLRAIELQSLVCEKQTWKVEGFGTDDYLDLFCKIDKQSPFREPFIGFCEDVLKLFSSTSEEAEVIVFETYKRWKKFWSPLKLRKQSVRWIKGLLGELHILDFLIDKKTEAAVSYWEGPFGSPHDFAGNGISLEIKTSDSVPPTVFINGLDQLAPPQNAELILCVGITKKDSGGKNLIDYVDSIEEKLKNSPKELETFWNGLALSGYRREFESHYASYTYFFSDWHWFSVDRNFPCLTQKSLKGPVDVRINKIKYQLEISGVGKLSESQKAENIKRLFSLSDSR